MPDKVHFLFHTKAIKYLKKLNMAEREKTLGLIKTRVYGFLYHNDRRYLTQDCNRRSPTATGAVVNGHSAVRQRPA